MNTVIFWFRNDLRLHDQRALAAALNARTTNGASHLLPVVCLLPAGETTTWGFDRVGTHRRRWMEAAVRDLSARMAVLGNPLQVCHAAPATVLPALARAVGATMVVCEDIAAPYEQAEVAALRAAGLQVHTVWHSSLLQPTDMPWPVEGLPAVFTAFRQAVERAGIKPPLPLPAPAALLPRPVIATERLLALGAVPTSAGQGAVVNSRTSHSAGHDARSSFP